MRLLLNSIFAFLAVIYSSCGFCYQYAPGINSVAVPFGKLIVVVGVLTNNMALYGYNYSFYFQRDGDSAWYQVPLIDSESPQGFVINVIAKAKGDRLVSDAKVYVSKQVVVLRVARSRRPNDFKNSPIDVARYQLVVGNGEDWPYAFRKVGSSSYQLDDEAGVDKAIQMDLKVR